ncbi:MAG: proline iminopeptidase-family hydrolase [Gaiellaceae bacterium]
MWTFDTFVGELDAVVAQLGLDRFSLLGHSWGGWLALEWLLRKPRPALAGLVLASTCASIPAFGRTTRALKSTLPQEVQDTLDRHEAAGTTDDPEHGAASFAYIRQFMVRADPIPEYLLAAAAAKNHHIADVMQGPEWNVNGRIADWDVTARLGEIDVPTLVTSGRYDEMTPWVVEPLAKGIRGAEWVVFDESAHVAHVEEPDRYVSVVRDFLRRVGDRRPAIQGAV